MLGGRGGQRGRGSPLRWLFSASNPTFLPLRVSFLLSAAEGREVVGLLMQPPCS